MLKLLKISPSHEDLFIAHYQRLLGWALQLTEPDRDLAEDLLHDAFIHFTTLTQPDLKNIKNLDGYFYGLLRNLHLSQERSIWSSPAVSLKGTEAVSGTVCPRLSYSPRPVNRIQTTPREPAVAAS